MICLGWPIGIKRFLWLYDFSWTTDNSTPDPITHALRNLLCHLASHPFVSPPCRRWSVPTFCPQRGAPLASSQTRRTAPVPTADLHTVPTRLKEDFDLLESLGVGGFGEVFRAKRRKAPESTRGAPRSSEHAVFGWSSGRWEE